LYEFDSDDNDLEAATLSMHPLRCARCNQECIYERCAPFGEKQEVAYGVTWRCPNCHSLSLDVCPLGPLVPARDMCLNCGAKYPSDDADALCRACGLSRHACQVALHLADANAGDPVALARAAFAQGLFRKGMAVLNQALQERMELREAWFLKTHFLNAIGFNEIAARMLDNVVARFTSVPDRIALLEGQSFLWADCEHGEEALRSADAALALGSDSVRTHYLRGRALALLGRLEEARDEMSRVLTLDPNYRDALHALEMIDGALRPTARKAWWQFWKK
jgi:tetratricopeptide (TPR) repeat protein